MPPYAYRYAVPPEVYEEHGVRRYGFHGTSHEYVAGRAAELLDRPIESLDLITLHLGNGASAAAIQRGRCIDTSMGLTPLEGLMMGTRSGDIDPAVVFHLARQAGWSNDRIETLLNRESGLKGVAGVNDMRDVLRRATGGDKRARLAVDMYAYRIRKYVGAYLAALGRADAVVFTAGIGENSPEIRAAVCQGLDALGLVIDENRNRSPETVARTIHSADSRIGLLVVPTDEERSIAEQTLRVIREG
jgi:acetate kinase